MFCRQCSWHHICMPGVITTLSNNAIRVLLKRNFKGATSSQCSIRIKYRLRRRRTRCNNTKHIRKITTRSNTSFQSSGQINTYIQHWSCVQINIGTKIISIKLTFYTIILFKNILMFQKSPLIYIASGNKISQFSQCTSWYIDIILALHRVLLQNFIKPVNVRI